MLKKKYKDALYDELAIGDKVFFYHQQHKTIQQGIIAKLNNCKATIIPCNKNYKLYVLYDRIVKDYSMVYQEELSRLEVRNSELNRKLDWYIDKFGGITE